MDHRATHQLELYMCKHAKRARGTPFTYWEPFNNLQKILWLSSLYRSHQRFWIFEDIKNLASEVETHLMVFLWELGKRSLALEICVFWGKLPGENSHVVCKRYIFFTTKEKVKIGKKKTKKPTLLTQIKHSSVLFSVFINISNCRSFKKKKSKTWKNFF